MTDRRPVVNSGLKREHVGLLCGHQFNSASFAGWLMSCIIYKTLAYTDVIKNEATLKKQQKHTTVKTTDDPSTLTISSIYRPQNVSNGC